MDEDEWRQIIFVERRMLSGDIMLDIIYIIGGNIFLITVYVVIKGVIIKGVSFL